MVAQELLIFRITAMRLSLSVRVAESPASKEVALMPFEELACLASETGFHALCMRASQAGIQTERERRREMRQVLERLGLSVSMVTADFDIPWNNERAPLALRNIGPHLDVAEDFGADLIRIGMWHEEDIPWAQRACDEARERCIRLAHQSHTETLFETVDRSVEVLKRVNRENFGLIYEPSNLHICGQDYGPATIARLAPWLMNVYLQNFQVTPEGPLKLRTWVRGLVNIRSLPFGAPGSIDFDSVFEGLTRVGYNGYVTVHHNVAEDMPVAEGVKRCYEFLTSRSAFEPRAAPV